MARKGRERRSANSTRGKRYSCTANQFPNVTEIAESPVDARVHSKGDSASRQVVKVSPVIRDKTRSDGTQPTSHIRARKQKTAPGAMTKKTNAAWEELTPRVLPPQWESKPSADVRFCRSTI